VRSDPLRSRYKGAIYSWLLPSASVEGELRKLSCVDKKPENLWITKLIQRLECYREALNRNQNDKTIHLILYSTEKLWVVWMKEDIIFSDESTFTLFAFNLPSHFTVKSVRFHAGTYKTRVSVAGVHFSHKFILKLCCIRNHQEFYLNVIHIKYT
jgi:hypothetical protein